MTIDTSVRMFGGAINNYATSPLSGCIADAGAMMNLFTELGKWPSGQARIQVNDQMTNADVKEALEWVTAKEAKLSAMFLSGHGGRRRRAAGGGGDAFEEFYCPYDVDTAAYGKELANDEWFEQRFADVPKGGKHFYFAFCCHSGGVANAREPGAPVSKRAPKIAAPDATPKYLRGDWEGVRADDTQVIAAKAFRRAEDNVFVDNDCDYVWFAAARRDQYSYEVSGVDGRFDVSRKALETILRATPNASVRAVHKQCVEWIRDTYGFDQTPQLWGPERLLDSDFFS